MNILAIICLGHFIKRQKSDKTREVASPHALTRFCEVKV